MTGVFHICIAMKPLEGNFSKNALKHGVAGLNIDGSRIPLNGDYKCGANGRPSQTGLGDNYDSEKANVGTTKGRWPANIVLDNSEEIRKAFPNTKSGAIKAGCPAGHDMSAGSEDNNRKGGRPVHTRDIPADSGSAARFFKQIGEYEDDE